jgi:hypothetical protein
MLEIFLMSVIVDVTSQELFNLLLFIKNLSILLNKQFLKLFLLFFKNGILLSCIFNINLKLTHQLLKIFHFFFIVVIIMVQLIVFFSKLLTIIFGCL